MNEFIFQLDDGLWNDETGEVVFKPSVKGELIRCKECMRWKDPCDSVCPFHSSGDPFIDCDPDENFYCGFGDRGEEC